MGSLTDEDEDDDEDFVQDAAPARDKKVQAKELKSGRLIGKGRSSIVYETTWKGQSYARKDFLRVPSDVFEREAARLAGLDEHPNVTRTHCWSVSEASCSLVVDLMADDLQNVMRNRRESAWQSLSPHPGSDDTSHVIDLHRFVEDAAPELRHPVPSTLVSTFSLPEALHIMLQIAEGIVFLHDNGVAHGDLKPKNILVAPSEQGGRSLGLFHVKMADFGLVETKMKSKALASQRARKLEIARWRAPELFENSYLLRSEDSDSDWDSDSGDHDCGVRTYGKLSRADVYSFAVTCAQILTGEDPYSGLGVRELVSRISGPNCLRPVLPQQCPAQLSDLINRCWGDELKRPSFINIRSELKDLQASLMSDSISSPVFEVPVSMKLSSKKIAKKEYSEITSSNPAAPTLSRGDLEITEAVGGPPGKADTFSIKSNEGSSKLTPVPKPRRRRKVHGCLGCVPVKTIRRNERKDIPEMKGIAKAAVSKKSPLELGRTIGPKSFTYAEVTTMTRNFKAEIGKGGFGHVYYGILPDGQQVAVKVGNSRQRKREFFNEVEFLSRVTHKNLVVLVGFCQEYYTLIYEYMENGSLHDHLHGKRKREGMLDWKKRLRIALNVAQGLEYLHTGCEHIFVHGDTNSSNVLLSSKYDAKLTDFGLTEPVGGASDSDVNTSIRGTPGYLDPEYYFQNASSPKNDIFSFGVVLLELITGCPALHQTGSGDHLLDWVRPALQTGDIGLVLDPALKSSVPAPKQEALWKVAELAIRCAEPNGVDRPIFSEVIYMLHQAMDLEPGHLNESTNIKAPGSPVKQNRLSWSSESLTKLRPIDLDSPSTSRVRNLFQKLRRRKAFNFLDKLGCIPAKFRSMDDDFSPSMGKGKEGVESVHDIKMSRGAKPYTYAEVAAITLNFKTEIGSGAFGPVYHGVLPSGKEVAVKVGDGFNLLRDKRFSNAVKLSSRLKHRNLVSLLGYCAQKGRNILIYEYMKNGSLTDHLLGNTKRRSIILDWRMRLRIALDVAQGLEYLHTGCTPTIIHRNVKSHNVLLTAHCGAKVTDFDLSRLMDASVSASSVNTRVIGTAGYLDPEYCCTNLLTTKSDIYSFGVVLLELITSRPAFDSSIPSGSFNLIDWVRTALEGGDINVVLDPVLKSSFPAPNLDALWTVADLAMRCVEPKAIHRPTTNEAVQELRAAMQLEQSSWTAPSGDPETVPGISSGSDSEPKYPLR